MFIELLFLASGASALSNIVQVKGDEPVNWGDEYTDFCPDGYLVSGMSIRVESVQGRGDDTSANAVQLCCVDPESENDSCTWVGQDGFWGDWTSKYCPAGQYVQGFENRIEVSQGGGDDTAMNGLRMWCIGGDKPSSMITVSDGHWGDWQKRITCPSLMMVIGLQQKIESKQGISGDDTALNWVRAECRNPKINVISGHWNFKNSFNTGATFAVASSVTETNGRTITDSTERSFEVSATASVTVGGDFAGGSVTAEQTITGAQAVTIGEEIQHTLATTKSQTLTVICKDEPGEREILYQWVWRTALTNGKDGLLINSQNYICNPASKPPLCTPDCTDEYCRTCTKQLSPPRTARSIRESGISKKISPGSVAFVVAVLAVAALGVAVVMKRGKGEEADEEPLLAVVAA